MDGAGSPCSGRSRSWRGTGRYRLFLASVAAVRGRSKPSAGSAVRCGHSVGRLQRHCCHQRRCLGAVRGSSWLDRGCRRYFHESCCWRCGRSGGFGGLWLLDHGIDRRVPILVTSVGDIYDEENIAGIGTAFWLTHGSGHTVAEIC